MFLRACEWGRKHLGPYHDQTTDWRRTLAAAYEGNNQHTDAANIYSDIIRWHREQSPVHQLRLAGSLMLHGRCLVNLDRVAEARPLLREAVQLWGDRRVAPYWSPGCMQSWLGECLLDKEPTDEAEELLLSGEAILRAEFNHIPGPFRHELNGAVERLVRFYEMTEDADAAAKWRAKLTK